MDSDPSTVNASWLRRHYKTILVLLFLVGLAGLFRVAFNYEPALNDGTYRFAGNDDYYHWRVVQFIQKEGRHLLPDPLLNYPAPAINPRPPLYNWNVAIEGRLLELTLGWSTEKASAYALEWGSASWGMLTVIPIWLIGRTVYGNRAGLWAGFLIAASPAHIQRAGFGLGDHDAFIVFWLCLGTYFLLRALQATRDDTRVEDWRSLRSIAEGLGAYADHHPDALAYAFLAGMCWSAIALMWEGFPYVAAIFAIYYVVQLLGHQIRRRDATGEVLVMLVVMGLLTLVPLPYYWTSGTIGGSVTATMYIFAGLVVLSAILVPTRDLPSVLVLPGLLAAGAVGVLGLRFGAPDILRQLLSADGYFNQSKLYSTIAEAQRTELGVLVFSLGFMTFFLAMIGFVYAAVRFFRKYERVQAYMVGWGLISIFMAFAAARFVFNAAPAFAVLGGWMVDRVVGWMNWKGRARDFQSLRHESWTKAVRSTMGARQITGVLFLGLTLVVPNVWFSFDAGFPGEVRANYRQNHPGDEFISKQTGAFGQGFLGQDWIDTYTWMRDQDATDAQGHPVPCEKRPAQMAWWDYGFWEVAIACHPTVADNFQNGVAVSGNFLTALSEKEGIEWMTTRLLAGDASHLAGVHLSPAVRADLATRNASLPDAVELAVRTRPDAELHAIVAQQASDLESATAFYLDIAQTTGTSIGYFLTDVRMMPLDTPDTPGIEAGSIFYAPVFLANKNPDDFVQTAYQAQGGGEYTGRSYQVDAAGDVSQLPHVEIIGPDGRKYLQSSSLLYLATPDGRQVDYKFNNGRGVPIENVKLKFHPLFYETMFYRGFVGGDGLPPPGGQNYHPGFLQNVPGGGSNLKHFRLVKDVGSVRLLKFYAGAELSGRVTMADDGSPVANAAVHVYDDMGIVHDSASTDASGAYKVLLPFGLKDANGTLNDTTVRVTRGNVELAHQSFKVSEAQADHIVDFHVAGGDFSIPSGNVDVFAYVDRDRDHAYDPSVDRLASGAEVQWGHRNATVDANGHAIIARVLPGSEALNGRLPLYSNYTEQVNVGPGQTTSTNVSFQVAPVTISGNVHLANGSAVADLALDVAPADIATEHTANVTAPPTSDASGNFSVELVPGDPSGHYSFAVNQSRLEGGRNVTYRASVDVDVRFGQPPPTVDVVVTREERPAS